jgi:hypothetical protein
MVLICQFRLWGDRKEIAMKRDMDLIRLILRQVESCDDPYGMESQAIAIEGYSEAQISGHIKMLIYGGLLEAKDESGEMGGGSDSYIGLNLTWEGQDFLSVAQDDSIWQKAKETVLKPAASMTFSILLEWLKQEAKIKIGLP